MLMISETKLNESFPIGQLLIICFSTPFRFDRNCHGGGIPFYIRKDMASKLLSIEENGIEGFYIEVFFYKEVSLTNKKKWLLN